MKASEQVDGDYIAFLDADDIWLENKLERQIEVFEGNNQIGFVYGRTEVIFENNQIILFTKKKRLCLMEIFFLSPKNFIVFSSAMVDKESLQCGGFPDHFLNLLIIAFLHMARVSME